MTGTRSAGWSLSTGSTCCGLITRIVALLHCLKNCLSWRTGSSGKSAGSHSLYAGLLLTERVGLLMKKRWAEFLTVFATGSFIPREIQEVITRFGIGRLSLLVINVGIV